MTAKGVKPDTAAAVAFLAKWSPDSPWVLTSIIPDGKTDTRTFQPTASKEAAKWIDERQGSQNLYFHVNPVLRPLTAKASKEDVARLAWLHIDIDPRAGEDHNEERDRALRLLREYKLRPTVIIDSGGGFQGFWKLNRDPKLEIDGSVEHAQELEAYNIQLEKVFGADHCHNVDRIMRIPGTINVPTARKQKKGRVPTLAKLVEWNEESVYDIAQFTAAPRVQSKDLSGLGGGAPKVQISGNVPQIGTEELREWARTNGKTITDHTLALIATGQDPLNPTKYGSRSEVLFRVCCDLVRAEVPAEMIFAVITGPNEIAVSVREKRGWQAYAIRQIERAQEEAIDPALRLLNEEYAVIADIGGKCRIIKEVFDPVMERYRLSKQSFEDFRNYYNNQRVQVGVDSQNQPVYKPLGTWWTVHPNRRQYKNIVFAPNREVKDAYNLWRGFSCDALPGEKHLTYLQHVRDNICGGNEEHYNFLVAWMARAVQKPDCNGEVAVVLRGKRGTGKSKFAKVFGRLFGRHFLQVADSKHLVGSFNAHLRDTVVLFGDEAFFAGDKRHEGVLKTLITEETIVIEGKGVDAESGVNLTHLILASNDDWVVPAGVDERRFLVLDVGNAQQQNFEFFKKIDEEIESGGLENLLYFLMNYDLSSFEVRRVPQTLALQEQKLLSMGPEVQWMYEKVWDGRLLEQDQEWPQRVLKDRLYNDYVLEMDKRRMNYRLSRTSFTRFLQRCCPEGSLLSKQEMADVPVLNQATGYEVMERKRAYMFYFPALDVMRKHWDNYYGGPYDWPKWEGSQKVIDKDEQDSDIPF